MSSFAAGTLTVQANTLVAPVSATQFAAVRVTSPAAAFADTPTNPVRAKAVAEAIAISFLDMYVSFFLGLTDQIVDLMGANP
jgi:hypothetical protein